MPEEETEGLTFQEQKKLIGMKKEALLLEHKLKMERYAYERESARIFHDLALQRERIKSAEIRRRIDRKGWSNFANDYSKDVKELPK